MNAGESDVSSFNGKNVICNGNKPRFSAVNARTQTISKSCPIFILNNLEHAIVTGAVQKKITSFCGSKASSSSFTGPVDCQGVDMATI